MSDPARTRYAPSPTGKPHIGNMRNAILSYLIARQTYGQFILRLEDTDRTRLVPEAEAAIYDSLRWLGLDWDEGPDIGGPYGPYVQSARLELYRAVAEQLVAQGDAYYCYCTPQRLSDLRAEHEKTDQKTGYDRRCRSLTATARVVLSHENPQPVIRFAIPTEGKTTFNDSVRGDIAIANAVLEDAVLLKADGYPTYHLAHLVDDHAMHITHVVRSEEWLPSAPLHANIHRALGWQPPIYIHPALILGEDGKKLSKRNGDTYVGDYREQGYSSAALVNFLALLGWSYDGSTEIFARQDLIRCFSPDKIQPNPARFAKAKLDWLNTQYLTRILSTDELLDEATPFLVASGLFADEAAIIAHRAELLPLVALVHEKLKYLTALPDAIAPFLADVRYDVALFAGKDGNLFDALALLRATVALLENDADGEFTVEVLTAQLRALAERQAVKVGSLFMVLRVALTGRTVSPGVPEMLAVLGRDRSLPRLRTAEAVLTEALQPIPV